MIELVRPAREWYDDRLRLAALADWLTEQGREPADGWGYFLEKPWKWTPEYREMCAEEEQDRLAEEEHAFRREGRYWPGPGDAA